MGKKEEITAKLTEYLSNPDNDWLSRTKLAVSVLGYANHVTLYKHVTPDELTAIEQEALTIRLKRMGGQVVQVVNMLGRRAAKGDVAAAKEYLKRTMGDKSIHDVNIKLPEGIRVEIVKARPELQEGYQAEKKKDSKKSSG